MTGRRFTTNKYYIYDHQKEDKWLCNEVEANEIVEVMNNLDIKSKERSKALSTLQKKYNNLEDENKELRDGLRIFVRFFEENKANFNTFHEWLINEK